MQSAAKSPSAVRFTVSAICRISRSLSWRVERGLIQCTFQGDEIGGIKRSDVRDAMVLEVTGAVREEPRAEHGVEVVLSAVKVLGKPYDQLPVPIGKKYMGLVARR